MKAITSSLAIVVVLVVLGTSMLLVLPRGIDASIPPSRSPSVADIPLAGALSESRKAPQLDAKFNTLALALDTGISDASDLVADIESRTTLTVPQVMRWDPAYGFTVYDPDDIFSDDFGLTVGDPVFVLMEGSTIETYSLVGEVPPQRSVTFNLTGNATTCKFNFISVPLDKSSLTTASALANDIGDVTQISKWDPTYGFVVYDPDDIFSDNFAVQIGYPYFVCMTASKIWPDW